MNELQNAKLTNAINQVAHSSLGIYCQTIIHSDGTRVERTEWQNGWNAAIIQSSKNIRVIRNFFKTLSNEVSIAIQELLESDILDIVCESNEKVTIYLNINDTFCYASADAEEVTSVELAGIYELWTKFGHDGVVAWVAINRNTDPLDELRTEKYAKAVKDIQAT